MKVSLSCWTTSFKSNIKNRLLVKAHLEYNSFFYDDQIDKPVFLYFPDNVLFVNGKFSRSQLFNLDLTNKISENTIIEANMNLIVPDQDNFVAITGASQFSSASFAYFVCQSI